MFATKSSNPYPVLDEFIATHFLFDSPRITSCRVAYELYVSWAKSARHPFVGYYEFMKEVEECLSPEIVKARPSNRGEGVPMRCFRGVKLTVKSDR